MSNIRTTRDWRAVGYDSYQTMPYTESTAFQEEEETMTQQDEAIISELQRMQSLYKKHYSEVVIGVSTDHIQVENSFFRRICVDSDVKTEDNGKYIKFSCVVNGTKFITLYDFEPKLEGAFEQFMNHKEEDEERGEEKTT